MEKFIGFSFQTEFFLNLFYNLIIDQYFPF